MSIKVSVTIPVYNEEKLVIKAIESIPNRDDLEIVIVDDCSTDNTWKVLNNYVSTHPNRNIKLFKNDKNEGVGYTQNRCIDNSIGTWIMNLDSDDVIITERFNDFVDNQLDETYDLVYYDLETNEEDPKKKYFYANTTKRAFCGSVKFIRRDWLGDLRATPRRFYHDLEMHQLMMAKNPKRKFTNIILVHYNFPKNNSLSYQFLHGEIDDHGNKK